MTFELLISAVDNGTEADFEKKLLDRMKVRSRAVLVCQCDRDEELLIPHNGNDIRVIRRNQRGVGLSRNTALSFAEADICLFSDEDIVYDEGYEEKVLRAFRDHPEADVITFNVRVDERRRTYRNETEHPVRWHNYGRYPAYALGFRTGSIRSKGIAFSELFGGGAKYSNGEDSLFLHDCLKAGLRIHAVTEELGEETYRESTWFHGYTDKFFFDRGVLYHFLYGAMAGIFGFRFLFKNRKVMLREKSLPEAFGLLRKGIAEGKRI